MKKRKIGAAIPGLLGLLAMLLLSGCGKTVPPNEGAQKLDAFAHVELTVLAADVYVESGEEYAIRYRLHGQETVEELEVRDGTLYFSTGTDWKPDLAWDAWEIVLTVPEQAVLGDVHLSAAAGDVILGSRTVHEAQIETAAGDIELTGVQAEELDLHSVSGKITVTDTQAGELEAESTSGDVTASGDFGQADLQSVSGDCALHGTLGSKAAIDTVSGRIDVTLQQTGVSVEADSIGGIRCNEERQGSTYTRRGDSPGAELKLHSVSGKIKLHLPAGTANDM